MSLEYFNQIKRIIQGYSKDPQLVNFGVAWSDKQIESALAEGGVQVYPSESNIQAFLFYRVIHENLYEIDLTMTDILQIKQGLMTALFKAWVAKLPTNSEIWLEVHENNIKAIKLYEKWGFSSVGQRAKYYPDGKTALLYSLRI